MTVCVLYVCFRGLLTHGVCVFNAQQLEKKLQEQSDYDEVKKELRYGYICDETQLSIDNIINERILSHT